MRHFLFLIGTALLTAAPQVQAAEKSIVLPVTARGNEPGWLLTLGDGKMVFRPMEGAPIEAALPPAEAAPGNGVRYAAAGLAATLVPQLCHDNMTGMPHPLTASVETGGKTLAGCAGEPAGLLAGKDWSVTNLGPDAIPKDAAVTISFDPKAGQISGASGCNRFFGGFTLSGEGLHVDEHLAGSMMACEPERMKLERAFLDTLPRVTRFDIAADGALLLKSGGETLIEARRQAE